MTSVSISMPKTIILKKIMVFCFMFATYISLYGQIEKEHLKSKTVSELIELFVTAQNESDAIEIGEFYIKLAKKKKDTAMISDGYILLISKYKDELKLLYTDSLINLTKNNPNKYQPTNAYLIKAEHYHHKKKLKLATDNYINANKLAKRFNNNKVLYDTNYMIGRLKDRICLLYTSPSPRD